MSDIDFQNIGKTGSIFWLIMIFYGFISFLYLGIKSIVSSNSILGLGIAMLFIVMMLISLFFSGKTIFEEEDNLSHSVLGFYAGFILVFILASLKDFFKFSIIGAFSLVNKQSLMSLLSSQLSPAEDFRLNVINVPTAEELLWLITIPMFVIIMLNAASKNKRLEWLENKYVQMVIVLIISGLSFAFFHVGQIGGNWLNKAALGFLASAFIFRTILLLASSEPGEKIIKTADITASFALGVHIANNWATYGFLNGLILLTQDFWGILFIAILLVFAIIALYKIYERWS